MKCSEKANTRDSTLLKLPSEIRNKIYEFTFGGTTLHVENNHGRRMPPKKTQLRRWKCCAEHTDHELVEAINTSTNLETFTPHDTFHEHRHEICRTRQSNFTFNKDLGILTSCRQIHREAALLPYELTTFCFLYLNDVTLLTNALIPVQRNAISTMKLYLEARPSPGEVDTAPSSVKLLAGLRDFTMFAQVWEYFAVRPPWHRIMNDIGYQDDHWQRHNLLEFATLGLTSARVYIHPGENLFEHWDRDQLANYMSLEDLKKWSRRTERMLLNDNAEDEVGEDDGESEEREAKRQKVQSVKDSFAQMSSDGVSSSS